MKSTHGYGLALLLLAVAVALRGVLDPVVGDRFPFMALVAAAAATVWFGGYRPAVLVVVLGYLASNYFFIEPRGAVWVGTTQGAVGSLAYLITCGIVIAFGESMRRARLRLAASEQRLRDDDRRKDEFLALLAHELRNPLAPIRNSVSVLQAGAGQPASPQVVKTMDRQLDQLVRLIDDLLDVNRMSRGTLELRRERLELASVVHEAVDACRPRIDRAGQTLTVRLPEQPVPIDADPVRLSQILGNVLSNASKFTPRGGTIALSADREGNDVVFSVRDNGVGIPSDQLEHVFEMFAQLTSPLDERQGGLGVGLSLVKQLVELHGGTVVARSVGIGKGSEFLIRLPIALDSADPAPSRSAAPLRQAGRRRRILVVDDNHDSAESLARLLELRGHETRLAYDGEEALGAAASYQPDFILLDIGLPKMSGYEACRRIREQAWAKDATIIALTGWGQDEDRRKSKQAGFDGHLVKPVDHKDLMSALE